MASFSRGDARHASRPLPPRSGGPPNDLGLLRRVAGVPLAPEHGCRSGTDFGGWFTWIVADGAFDDVRVGAKVWGGVVIMTELHRGSLDEGRPVPGEPLALRMRATQDAETGLQRRSLSIDVLPPTSFAQATGKHQAGTILCDLGLLDARYP